MHMNAVPTDVIALQYAPERHSFILTVTKEQVACRQTVARLSRENGAGAGPNAQEWR
jgi:hypothetical protein